MDVTSLLNVSSVGLNRRDSTASSSSAPSATGDTTAASTAVPTPSPERTLHSGRGSGSRSPAKNRTPWDAGGYSLPLTIDTKSIPTHPIGRPTYSSDSPTDGQTSVSPNSPGHKYSNSHGSLSSSYTSSTNSGSHSRISSLSTVSEHQHPSTTLKNDFSLDSNKPTSTAAPNPTMASEQLDASASGHPAAPTNGDNNIHQTRLQRLQGEQSIDLTSDRPESPSDALMIRRGQNGRSHSGRQVSTLKIPSFASFSSVSNDLLVIWAIYLLPHSSSHHGRRRLYPGRRDLQSDRDLDFPSIFFTSPHAEIRGLKFSFDHFLYPFHYPAHKTRFLFYGSNRPSGISEF